MEKWIEPRIKLIVSEKRYSAYSFEYWIAKPTTCYPMKRFNRRMERVWREVLLFPKVISEIIIFICLRSQLNSTHRSDWLLAKGYSTYENSIDLRIYQKWTIQNYNSWVSMCISLNQMTFWARVKRPPTSFHHRSCYKQYVICKHLYDS